MMDDTETFSVAALVAPHPAATSAGRDVLIEGGSVIEAAIAAACVSAVVVPHRNGLGGDALWLFREPGPRGLVRVLDARGLTGHGVERSLFRRHDVVPSLGTEATLTVPGAVAGWASAYELSTALGGRLPLSRLLQPALEAARTGSVSLASDVEARTAAAPHLSALPGFAPVFLTDGKVPEVGTLWQQPALALTLDYLIQAGLEDFYRGDVGRELAADLEELSSPLDRDDLRRGEARWRWPASLDLGRQHLEVAPNRQGIELALALGLFLQLGRRRSVGFEHWHDAIESAKHAKRLFDDELRGERDPLGLVDSEWLKRESLRIDRGRASAALPWRAMPFAEDAIFVGAVDRDGGAVALIQSLGGAFGSGVVASRTGILLGNRGAALALDPDAGPLLGPGQQPPLVSVPAFAASRDGRITSLGTTGPGAGVSVLQVASRVLLGAELKVALDAPRFAFGAAEDGPDTAVRLGDACDSSIRSRLRSAAHEVVSDDHAAPRTSGAVSRLPSGRIEAAVEGDAGQSGDGL